MFIQLLSGDLFNSGLHFKRGRRVVGKPNATKEVWVLISSHLGKQVKNPSTWSPSIRCLKNTWKTVSCILSVSEEHINVLFFKFPMKIWLRGGRWLCWQAWQPDWILRTYTKYWGVPAYTYNPGTGRVETDPCGLLASQDSVLGKPVQWETLSVKQGDNAWRITPTIVLWPPSTGICLFPYN